MNEASNRSRYIRMHVFFFFPIYTVIEQIRSVSHMSKKVVIGSHLTDRVNKALDIYFTPNELPPTPLLSFY